MADRRGAKDQCLPSSFLVLVKGYDKEAGVVVGGWGDARSAIPIAAPMGCF